MYARHNHSIVNETDPLLLALKQARAAVESSAKRIRRQQASVLEYEMIGDVDDVKWARDLLSLMQRNHARREENLKRLADIGLVAPIRH
jgi:hypothetical protein